MKSTPVRGVKQNLKPCAYKQFEAHGRKAGLRACLLKNEPASYVPRQG